MYPEERVTICGWPWAASVSHCPPAGTLLRLALLRPPRAQTGGLFLSGAAFLVSLIVELFERRLARIAFGALIRSHALYSCFQT